MTFEIESTCTGRPTYLFRSQGSKWQYCESNQALIVRIQAALFKSAPEDDITDDIAEA